MNTTLDFKKRLIEEFIRKKEAKLDELRNEQRKQLENVNTEDIDNSNVVESPREQMLEEVRQQSDTIDFLSHEIELLKNLDTNQPHATVSLGALVQTNLSTFLIGGAQEQFVFENHNVAGLSANAPVFKKMEGLKAKAEFHYGNKEYVILEVI